MRCLSPVVICSGAALRGYAISPSPFFLVVSSPHFRLRQPCCLRVAGTLLNSALIYAGNNLKLFTDRLHNQHGDILAGNSLWVQKDASGGANTEIINNSGNIETHQGDIVVRTGHLLNQREGFSATTTTRTNPSSIHGNGKWTLVDIPLSLSFPFVPASYGYFTREVENQHGTPCNGHGAMQYHNGYALLLRAVC